MKSIKRIANRLLDSPTLMNWVNQLAVFAHGIFITSIILVKFPNLEYSFWMLLKTLTAFGILAEAGLGRTVERSVSFFFSGADKLPKNKKEYNDQIQSSTEPNIKQMAQLLYTTKFIYLIVSVITIILLATVGVATLWNLFNLSNNDRSLWIAFFLMILQTFFLLQGIKWKSFMTGTQNLIQLYRLNTIMSVVRIFAFLAILLSNLGIEYLMAYLVLEQAFLYVYFRAFMRRWFRKNGLNLKSSFKLDKEIFSSLWSVSWKSGLNTWGFFFSNRGVELLTSQLKDTSLMASFLFTTTILRFIRNIAQAPMTVRYPEVFALMAGKKFDQLKKAVAPRIFLSQFIMIIGFAAFGITGNWLLHLIGAEDKSLVPASIFILMSFFIFMETHALYHGTIYISTNDVPFLIPGLITGILTFVLGGLILPRWGLLGLIILQVVLNLGNNFWYSTYLSLKLTQWPFRTYLKNVFIDGPVFWKAKLRESLT